MNIELPDHFYYSSDKRNRSHAYVYDGCLYVVGGVDYEQLMYILTYVIKGYDRCEYCGRRLDEHNRTLDHRYPRNWGGISIPENLIPSCSSCNSEKSNLTGHQYREWLKMGEPDRRDYRQACIEENEKKMQRPSFILPKKWVRPFDPTPILPDIDFEWLESEGNEEMDSYYERNGHYPRPIVVSSNNWVFKGSRILYHAQMHGITKVPAVVLENVVRLKKPRR